MKEKSLKILLATCTATLLFSGGMLIHNYLDSIRQNEKHQDLIHIVEESKDNEAMPYDEDTNFLAQYQELYKENNDMVGWLKIEDTPINYPVMQTINNPNYYLRRGFDKQYTVYGLPYIQENCDLEIPSDNLIIYGHHMNDGSMFASLMKYTNKSYWENHKLITFDTLNQHNEYEIFAAFKTTAYGNDEESFKYYRFINAEDEKDFNQFITECKELSFYDTGITPKYGDKLITLSTCEYSQKDGRMIVVARKVDKT